MRRRLVFRRAAEDELQRARDWYARIRAGLAEDFERRVEHALRRVRRNPRAFPCVHGEARRVLLRRFPYGIYFLLEDERIVVLAVFHASRDPIRWQRRRST